MSYKASIKYLETFQKRGIRLGLERIETILFKLGDPQNAYKSIHIAGTNGKGSVAAMLSSILNKAGYKVGLYTSPHLVDYTERVRINEKDISRQKFAEAVDEARKAIKELPQMDLTEFEVLTAAAFLMMKKAKVEIAVVEVGLGGRLDATNVITPVLSVITNIGFDHTDVLGNSIGQIAREKGGIIKSGVPLLTGEKRTLNILRKICHQKGSKLITSKRSGIRFHPLNGGHQVDNTNIVLTAIAELKQAGFDIKKADIDRGLRATRWPGRLQRVSEHPLIIVDGAHNPDGARALVKYLSSFRRKFDFIVGMQANKDIGSYVRILRPIADRFITVRSSNPGSLPASALARMLGPKAEVAHTIEDAIKTARSRGSAICLTGSLYLIGDVFRKNLFDRKPIF